MDTEEFSNRLSVEHFRYMGEYSRRVLRRMSTAVGVVVGLGAIAAAVIFDWKAETVAVIEVIILLVVGVEATYGVFRQERSARAEREQQASLIAKPASLAWNLRNPAPDEVDFEITVVFEIWTSIDLNTSELVLNVVGVSGASRKFWRKRGPGRRRLFGVRPRGQDTAIFRQAIRAVDAQPYSGEAVFDWRGKFEWKGPVQFELAIRIGTPSLVLRDVVDSRMWERGTTAPL